MIAKGKFQQLSSLIAIFTLLLFIEDSSAIYRTVSGCKSANAVLRSFGNSCLDHCLPQFNKSKPCFNRITLGCDCGYNKCLYNGKCITKINFAKIYQKIEEQEYQKILDYRESLEVKIKKDATFAAYINKIYTNKPGQKKRELSGAQLASKKYIQDAKEYIKKQQVKKKEANKKSQEKIKTINSTPTEENSNASRAIKFLSDKNKNTTPKLPQFYIDNNSKKLPGDSGKSASTLPIPMPLPGLEGPAGLSLPNIPIN